MPRSIFLTHCIAETPQSLDHVVLLHLVYFANRSPVAGRLGAPSYSYSHFAR
jgi:hypothetical protein